MAEDLGEEDIVGHFDLHEPGYPSFFHPDKRRFGF
jgi:hypothetical protein